MFVFFAICLSSSCCWARKASISARVPRIFVSSISSTRPQSDGLLPPSSTAYRGALCLYKSKDFGQCKGLRYGDGQHCLNIVNLSKSEYCIHHERSKAKGGQRVPIQYHIQETKKATNTLPKSSSSQTLPHKAASSPHVSSDSTYSSSGKATVREESGQQKASTDENRKRRRQDHPLTEPMTKVRIIQQPSMAPCREKIDNIQMPRADRVDGVSGGVGNCVAGVAAEKTTGVTEHQSSLSCSSPEIQVSNAPPSV
jgi:hypothetical protein